MEYDLLYKVLLIGDSGVGKSSLVVKAADGEFNDAHISTIGVDFKIVHLDHYGKRVKMQVWDTAGQERFRVITTSYYRGAHGIFICFDLCERASFEHLNSWVDEVTRYAKPEVSVVIVGNKTDLADRRVVPYEEAKSYADERGFVYLEASAKTEKPADLSQKMFFPMIEKMRAQPVPLADREKGVVEVGQKVADKAKRRGCC